MQYQHQPPRRPNGPPPYPRKQKSNSLKYILIGTGVFILLCIVAGVAASGDDTDNATAYQEQTEVAEEKVTTTEVTDSVVTEKEQPIPAPTPATAAEGLRVYSYDIHQEYITLRYETETPGTVELSLRAYNKDNGKSMDDTFTLDSDGEGTATDLSLPYPLTRNYNYHITLTDRRTGKKLIDEDWHY